MEELSLEELSLEELSLEELSLEELSLEELAPQGQQAHSPGQSVAAPRDSNIANTRALQGQKHKNIWI
ncbi:hypothetical protein HPS58_03130 [Prevotella sp. PJ1A]|nr:hypothetical protein [Prevotella sp. PJ1A]NPE37410.1 hypothetical protein [Prevotella sp. PCJ2]